VDGRDRLKPVKDELAHLICISINAYGLPQGLFVVNRWVSDESWYSTEETIALVDRFRVGHATPHFAVNQWITAFMALCRPQITARRVERRVTGPARRRTVANGCRNQEIEMHGNGYRPDPSTPTTSSCNTRAHPLTVTQVPLNEKRFAASGFRYATGHECR
jgi:hypothetical protein